MTFATIMISCGIYFFKIPNHFSIGVISGILVFLGALFNNIPTENFIFMINMLLLLAGFLIIGKGFGAKTVYCSMLMSVLVILLKKNKYPLLRRFVWRQRNKSKIRADRIIDPYFLS